MEITKNDIKKIKQLSKDPHIYNKLIKSILPHLHGYKDIKEAILLQLFMGVEKQFEEHNSFKEGINILIIANPNMEKTLSLESLQNICIKNKFSYVGNIHNLKEDEVIKLINPNQSILAFTEFKKGYEDKCSIPQVDINVSKKIEDRFDLIFVIHDDYNAQDDTLNAEHLLKLHQSKTYDVDISSELLTKYIVYSYVSTKPKLTEEANNVLRENYVAFRKSTHNLTPINLKQLETTIKLAEASAKIKLKEKVNKEDAEKAIKLMIMSLKDKGVNPEVGECGTGFNISKIARDRENKQKVLKELDTLGKMYDGQVPEEVLFLNMGEYNISNEEVKSILKSFEQKGMVYSLSPGVWRKIA